MMTRKHYKAIADAILCEKSRVENSTYNRIVKDAILSSIDTLVFDLVDIFASDNPNFDEDRFDEAITVETG